MSIFIYRRANIILSSLVWCINVKIITINVPDAYITAIKSLCDLDLYQSRSEFVREALKSFLDTEASFEQSLDPEDINELFKDVNPTDLVGKEA